MFRLLYTTVFILLISNAKAGGCIFPNVSFSTTKVFLFNLEKPEKGERYYSYIYKDSSYAKKRHELPLYLTSDFHKKIQSIFKHGIDDLIIGLSKCFLPRHGIVYYDDEGIPVASLSICFECESIRVWSKEGYTFSYDYDNFDRKKAEKQMQQLEKVCAKTGMPIYRNTNPSPNYLEYLKNNP